MNEGDLLNRLGAHHCAVCEIPVSKVGFFRTLCDLCSFRWWKNENRKLAFAEWVKQERRNRGLDAP